MNQLMSFIFILGLLLGSCSSDESKPPEPEPPNETEPEIVWDESSRIRISDAMPEYNGYARLIELENGQLLVVYESKGRIVTKKSTNKGETWSNEQVVVEPQNNLNLATPDIIQLDNNDIIIAYNPRPTDASPADEKFTIRTIKSTDNGATWNNDQEVHAAGTEFENGCWEPSMLQLPNGEVQLYFSNEGIYTVTGEQNISMVRSTDNGESWSTDPVIVSFRAGRRDGMPSPIFIPSINSVVLSIEDNGENNQFKVYTIRNTLAENWSNTVRGDSDNRSYALANRLPNNVYAGAPYLAKLSNGKVLLSYQSTENKLNHDLNQAEMIVAIGDNQAKNFKYRSVPFSISAGRSALWNSIAVLSDNSIVALTTTNNYSNGASEVWMIKGTYKE